MPVSAVQRSMMKRDGRLVSRAALEEMRLMALQRRSPLRSGEKLADRVHDQLSDIAARPGLVRAFFRHPSVAYISDL
ncbi:hypothetical protein FE36_16055 [Xanthomonas oryzae pv. oryzicola]|nr:hypothetical protein FE36_16055 [Xanthomonas oryzae pv. oryzicola]